MRVLSLLSLLLCACSDSTTDGEIPLSTDPVVEQGANELRPLPDDLPDSWEFRDAIPVNAQGLGAGAGGALTPSIIPGQYVAARMWVPANQAWEYFVFQTPLTPQAGPAPLLVVFHQWNASHGDVLNTGFLSEAANRGWFVLAPLGRWNGAPGNGQNNFGAIPAQIATMATLEWMLSDPRVDSSRVFGVGFSMGGGWMMSTAARYPNTFSALVNHTGGLALMDTFAREPLAAADLLTIHGASPAVAPFEYERTSTVVLDLAGQLAGGNHMAANLKDTPLQTWYSLNNGSQTQYLVDQCLQLEAYFGSIGATNHTVVTTTGMGHNWGTLDYAAVSNWFAQQAPLAPSSTQGRWLLDRGGIFGPVAFDQDVPGFSDVAFGGFAATNHFVLVATNVGTFRANMNTFGIDPLQPYSVFLDTDDGVDFVYSNCGQTPIAVTRNSLPTIDWNWASDVLTVHERQGGQHTWNLQ